MNLLSLSAVPPRSRTASRFRRTQSALCLLLLSSATIPAHAQYVAVFLDTEYNVFSYGRAVSGRYQVGNIEGGAYLWHGSEASAVSITPKGFDRTIALGIDGNHIVGLGSGYYTTNDDTHALLWGVSANDYNKYVDLHPQGTVESEAVCVSGDWQAGWALGPATGYAQHAYLWHGSAASAVDLNPRGFGSVVMGIYGDTQVGMGAGPGTHELDHALLWHGSASSVVDLTPVGIEDAQASAAWGDQQVGAGSGQTTNLRKHALLWNGSANRYADIHPAGFDESYGMAINGKHQAGFGYLPDNPAYAHALAWNGTKQSAVDLQAFLPADYADSLAYGVDANGDVIGFASPDRSAYRAVLWRAVPEPGAWNLLVASSVAGLALRRRGRKKSA